jgi:hypothetical protein
MLRARLPPSSQSRGTLPHIIRTTSSVVHHSKLGGSTFASGHFRPIQPKGSCSDRADPEGTNVYCRRSKTRATWVAVQECPPRAVGTPRSLSARAIAQSVSTPLCCRSRIIDRRSAARSLARLTWTARPVALACSDNAVPRLPPRSFPRAFAAASAAFVLLEISPASSSATAAICCKMKRPVGPSIAGRSAKRTSTPASRRRERKLTDLVRRSTLATTNGHL